jgi:hypothetical protein
MGNFLCDLKPNNSCTICKKFIIESENFISCKFCREMIGHKECVNDPFDCPFCDFYAFS